ncbi:MAG: hypothetical protein WKF84_07045 [Pyrinomonadaceae bacterium]
MLKHIHCALSVLTLALCVSCARTTTTRTATPPAHANSNKQQEGPPTVEVIEVRRWTFPTCLRRPTSSRRCLSWRSWARQMFSMIWVAVTGGS